MGTPSEGAAVRGSCGKARMLASELRAEPSGAVQVGSPESHRYRGRDMTRHRPRVSAERAQARNLGGTAKQPFALNEGGRLF